MMPFHGGHYAAPAEYAANPDQSKAPCTASGARFITFDNTRDDPCGERSPRYRFQYSGDLVPAKSALAYLRPPGRLVCPKNSIYAWPDFRGGLQKAYIFETSLSGKTIRMTIGDPRTWKIADAQAEATRLKAMTDTGTDPRRVKAAKIAADEAEATASIAKQARETTTLDKAWSEYIWGLGVIPVIAYATNLNRPEFRGGCLV